MSSSRRSVKVRVRADRRKFSTTDGIELTNREKKVRDAVRENEAPKGTKDKVKFDFRSDSLAPFLTEKAVFAKKRVFSSRANDVFTHEGKGIKSNDPSYLRYLRRLASSCNREFAPENSEGFAVGHPITTDFNALHSVSGYFSDPVDVPPKDNTDDLRAKGINVDGFVTPEAEIVT